MKLPFLMAAALVLGSTAVQAAQQNFGASPGAPGSSTFNPNPGMTGSDPALGVSRGIGTFGASPGAPGSPIYNPTAALPSSNSPNPTIPSLDSVIPGASSSGLLGSSASGTSSSGSGTR
jgi:hypothetical protein